MLGAAAVAIALDLHPGAEIHALRIAAAAIGCVIDDGHPLEAFAQKAHPAIDFVQAFFAVGVFGIFGAIALRRGFGHGERHPRTLLMPQLIEFILEALGAFRGDVFGAGRGGRTVS